MFRLQLQQSFSVSLLFWLLWPIFFFSQFFYFLLVCISLVNCTLLVSENLPFRNAHSTCKSHHPYIFCKVVHYHEKLIFALITASILVHIWATFFVYIKILLMSLGTRVKIISNSLHELWLLSAFPGVLRVLCGDDFFLFFPLFYRTLYNNRNNTP